MSKLAWVVGFVVSLGLVSEASAKCTPDEVQRFYGADITCTGSTTDGKRTVRRTKQKQIVETGEYKNGKKHGTWIENDLWGRPKMKVEYKAGQYHGILEGFTNGAVSERTLYRDGVEHGRSRLFYDGGKLILENIFDLGRLTKQTSFHAEHGSIKCQRSFSSDPNDEEIETCWNEKGIKSRETRFKGGIIVREESFLDGLRTVLENGKLVEEEWTLCDGTPYRQKILANGVTKETTYYPNGQKEQLSIVGGGTHTLKEWCADGTPKLETPCQDMKFAGTNSSSCTSDEVSKFYGTDIFCSGSLENGERVIRRKGTKSLVETTDYKNSKRHGTRRSFDHCGRKRKEGHYSNGHKHGTITLFDNNGKPSKEQVYQHGVLHGETKSYFKGTVASISRYESGELVGETTYHENSSIRCHTPIKHGELHGLAVCKYPNGKKQSSVRYKMGRRSGVEKEWNEDGRLIYRGKHRKGKRVGERKKRVAGKLRTTEIYTKSGTTTIDYYPDGTEQSLYVENSNGTVSTVYYPNGKKQSVSTKPKHGEAQREQWYPNGQKKLKGPEFLEDGVTQKWFENGQPEAYVERVDGTEIIEKRWDQTGKLTRDCKRAAPTKPMLCSVE